MAQQLHSRLSDASVRALVSLLAFGCQQWLRNEVQSVVVAAEQLREPLVLQAHPPAMQPILVFHFQVGKYLSFGLPEQFHRCPLPLQAKQSLYSELLEELKWQVKE